jgi:hypothetical protein
MAPRKFPVLWTRQGRARNFWVITEDYSEKDGRNLRKTGVTDRRIVRRLGPSYSRERRSMSDKPAHTQSAGAKDSFADSSRISGWSATARGSGRGSSVRHRTIPLRKRANRKSICEIGFSRPWCLCHDLPLELFNTAADRNWSLRYLFLAIGESSTLACLFHPWKREKSPAFHASRSPGVLRSQSGRISLVTARRSRQRSMTDGRPQNQ